MPPTSNIRRTQPAPDNARRHSGRQPRAGTNRPFNYYARPFGSIGGATNEPQDDSPPGFFPAIQYFTDSIAALPKEVMRHFTLMKEVEAKIHGPSRIMTDTAGRIMDMPAPPRGSRQPSQRGLLSFTANNSATASVNGSVVNGAMPGLNQQASDVDEQPAHIDPQADMARRQEFHNLRMVIQSILINLDEKNACLAEANRTLDRQLSRVESVMPHVEAEISEEARLGSLAHWAYVDNRVKKTTAPATAERARREVAAANSLAAAAATVHEGDIAAVRSEARREAKKSRNQQVDSEFEDRPGTKKTTAGKGRKAGESESKGLGIVNGIQPQKRRKVEKAEGAPMERTLSGVLKAGKGAGSTPRATPAAEPTKKKKAAPPAPPAKKRNAALGSPAQSPRLAQSPVMSNFALLNDPAGPRPASSRIRQNSSTLAQSMTVEKAPSRPASAAGFQKSKATSDKSHRNSVAKTKDVQAEDRMDVDEKKEETNVDRGQGAEEGDKERTSRLISRITTPAPDDAPALARTRSTGVRSTESQVRGRLHKQGERNHSRSASNQHILKQIASFNRSPETKKREGSMSDDRDNDMDSGDNGSVSNREGRRDDSRPPRRSAPRQTSRRSQGRSLDENETSPVRQSSVGEPELEPDNGTDADVPMEQEPAQEVEMEEEENDHDPDDPDEPKYCYCGRGSYGTMIACENSECEREWFHLECTGLRTVPNDNVKWFCDDCEPNKRKKSRPISRH